MTPTLRPKLRSGLAAALLLAACQASPTPPPAPTETPWPPLPSPTEATPTPPPAIEPTPSAVPPTATLAPVADDVLVPAGRVRAYPGPAHYAGDVLSFEIQLDEFVDDAEATVALSVDGAPPVEVAGRWQANQLLVPLALDTTGLEGAHTLALSAQSGGRALEETYALHVQPATARPEREAQAAWLARETECCTLHYIGGTAAERDLDRLAEVFQAAAGAFSERAGRPIGQTLQVYFLDRMWGNGAFGGNGEMAVVYTDRYYGPGVGEAGLHTLALHEFTHASGVDQNEQGFFLYNEGLAVYLAGGHYKPEPLPERGAALEALGYYAGRWPYAPHEASYLNGAVNVAYVVETYGWDKLWAWVAAAHGGLGFDEAALAEMTQQVFGQTPDEFEAAVAAWRQSHAPGAQVDDLRLTAALQMVRRQYQDTYAPPPMLAFGLAAESYGHPPYLPIVVREPATPPHVAVELMIANGQAAIAAGDYALAEALVAALEATVPTGTFDDPLAAAYLAAVLALAEAGHEVVGLTFNEDTATARVIGAWPALEEVTLEHAGDGWQVRD